MIGTKQVRDWLQSQLYDSEKEFAIFCDVADFKKVYKLDDSNTITRYTNGIVEALQPTMFPIKNLQVATQTFIVRFPIDIEISGKDANGNYLEVERIKEILLKFASVNNGKPFTQADDSNVNFEITPAFNGITVGVAEPVSPLGLCLPIEMNISLTMVESGINTNNFDVYLNNENLFYQQGTLIRSRMAETNSTITNGATTTAVQSNSMNIHLTSPLISSPQNLAILQDILLGGNNKPNIVKIKAKYGQNNLGQDLYQEKIYLMTFGQNQLSLEVGKNAGNSIDLVEVSPLIAEFDNTWIYSYVVGTANWTITKTLTAGQIWWAVFDDGTIFERENTTNESITVSISGTASDQPRLYYHSKVV